MDPDGSARPSLSELTPARRAEALDRLAVLRPFLEKGVPLARAAVEAGVPIRTARRWLARYRAYGLAGLARRGRLDAGRRRTGPEVVALIEGLALAKPRPSVATIHRRIAGSPGRRRSGDGPCRRSAPCTRSWAGSIRPRSRWRMRARPPDLRPL